MILNDVSREPSPADTLWPEVDRRLTDDVGHTMLAYGDEILVERRGRRVHMRFPLQGLVEELDRLRYPAGLYATSIDGEDFYISMIVTTIKEQFPLPDGSPRHPERTPQRHPDDAY